VPYVFVPGNHDSQAVVAALRAQPNVVIADHNMVEVKGLKIFGVADPAAYQSDAKPVVGLKLAEFSREAAVLYKALPSKPDIVAVHSIVQAKELMGRVSLILTGHTHQPSLKVVDGTLIDNAGTTGAAGLRTFEVKDGVPYSLKLLYFEKRPKKLVAVDSLALSGESRDFMLERRLIAKGGASLKKPPSLGTLNLSWRTN
jgi:predicted phosphodiesterase